MGLPYDASLFSLRFPPNKLKCVNVKGTNAVPLFVYTDILVIFLPLPSIGPKMFSFFY